MYIDGAFDHHYKVNATTGTRSNEHKEIHVMDDRIRIANLRIGTPFSGDNAPAVRYYLEDHLGNCSFTLESNGSLFSREECFPFGETSFGSFAKKRYRFCGKERDEESGLYYYGARYYAPWTCRFVSVDPLAGEYPYYTPYQYAGNQPVIAIDLDGLETDPEKSNGMQSQPEGTNDSYHSGTPLKNGYYASDGKAFRKFDYSGILSGTPQNYVEQSPHISSNKQIPYEHAAPIYRKAYEDVESKYKNESIEEKAKKFNAIIADYTLATQDGLYGQSNCNSNSKLTALYGYDIIDQPTNDRREIITSQNFIMDKFGLTKDQLDGRSSGNKVSNCFTDCNWSVSKDTKKLKRNRNEYDKLQREAINLVKKPSVEAEYTFLPIKSNEALMLLNSGQIIIGQSANNGPTHLGSEHTTAFYQNPYNNEIRAIDPLWRKTSQKTYGVDWQDLPGSQVNYKFEALSKVK